MKLEKSIVTMMGRGNIGKTTSIFNIAKRFHQQFGCKPLVVDIDPQAGLSDLVREGGFENLTFVSDVLKSKKLPTLETIDAGDFYFLAANNDLEEIYDEVDGYRLRDVLSGLNMPILVDAPPTMGFLTRMTLVAATHVIGLSDCEPTSARRLKEIVREVEEFKSAGVGYAEFAGVIINKVRVNSNKHTATAAALRAEYKILGEIRDDNSLRACRRIAQAFVPVVDNLVEVIRGAK